MKHETIEVQEVDLTSLFADLGIKKIEQVISRWVVLLNDGRLGIGSTVGEAYEKATAPDASNVLQVAA